MSSESITTNFPKLLLDQKGSRLFNLSLLILEYLQIISQIVLFTTKGSVDADISNYFCGHIIKVTNIINIGYYIGINQSGIAEYAIVIMCAYILLIYLSVIYILIASAREKNPNQLIVGFARWTIQLHGRFMSYIFLMCSIGWLKTNFTDSDRDSSPSTIAFAVISICLLVLNYILPLYMWSFYSYQLPSKSVLAASSYTIEKITLFQKTFHGVLYLVLPTEYNINNWTRWAFNLALGITRVREFFLRFPNYNLQALFWKGAMIVIPPTLNICLLVYQIQALVNDQKLDLLSWIYTSIPIIGFVEIIYFSIYRRELSNILMKPFTYLSPYKLIHKIQYTKQAKHFGRPFIAADLQSNFWRLALSSLDPSKKEDYKGFEGKGVEGISVLQDSDKMKKSYLKSLQEGLAKYPKSESLKLYCAYYFGKKLGLFSISMQLLKNLEKSTWHSSMSLTAKILRDELQNTLRSRQNRTSESLDIMRYVSITTKLKNVQQKMVEQVDLQTEFYKEWALDKFDIEKIQVFSKKIELLRSKIDIKSKRLLAEKPDFYLEPLILFAYYAVQVNFSTTDYFKYIQAYTQKLQRYETKLHNNDFTPESLYDNLNFELILSTDKSKPGIVTACSQNIHKVLGAKPSLFIGKAFSSLAPPSLTKCCQEMINKSSNPDNEASVLQNLSLLFMTHSDGHIIPVNCYISLYPNLEKGVFLHVMLRPLIDTKEYIIVTKDGHIESYTRSIAKELNLPVARTEKIHVGRLNKQLYAAGLFKNSPMSIFDKPKEPKEHGTSMEGTLHSLHDKHGSRAGDELNNNVVASITPSLARLQIKKATQKVMNVQRMHHNKFYNEGENLDLVPLTNKDKEPLSFFTKVMLANNGSGVKYNCKIENKYYGKTLVKLLVLEHGKDHDDENSYLQKKQGERASAIFDGERHSKPEHSYKVIEKIIEETVSGNFVTEAERIENENIEISKLDDTNNNTGIALDSLASPKAPLMALTSQRHTPMGLPVSSSTRRRTVVKVSLQELADEPYLISSNRRIRQRKHMDTYNQEMVKENAKFEPEPVQSVGAMRTKADERRVYASLKGSLDMKYYSPMIRLFLWICFASILFFIASQLATGIDSAAKFNDLTENKDVLVNAQTRIDLIIKVQRRFRILGTVPEGLLTETQISQQVPGGINTFIGYATSELNQLSTANENLLRDASLLDEKERKNMFANNVRVFSSGGPVYNVNDTYDYLNTIQAANRLIDLSMRALALSQGNLVEALPVYYLISRNSLDDMLVESEKNTDSVSTLLETSHTSILVQTKAVLAAVASMIGVLLIGAVMILRKLYKREASVLTNVSKIDEMAVQNLVKEMIRFKINVNEEYYYEEANNDYMEGYCARLLRLERQAHSKRKKGKTVKKTRLVIKYVRHLLKVGLFFAYLMVLLIVDRVLLLNTTSKLYSYVSKIQFIKQLQVDSSLVPTSFVEILASNATTTVMNQNCGTFFDAQILKFANLRVQLPTVLLSENNTLDTFIQEALSGNGCGLLSQPLQGACFKVSTGSQVVGLLQLMSSLENMLSSNLDIFLESNRTTQDSSSALFAVMASTVPINNVLTGLYSAIFVYLTERFDDTIGAYAKQNIILNSVGTFFIVLMNWILWVLVLKRLKESDYDLKKVLKNFPLSLVMSNSILRAFIFETGGNHLNSLKEKI